MSTERPLDVSLSDWLHWLEQLHPTEIELGLERVREVALRAELTDPGMPIITVAGTNGKGSTVAMLVAIYRQAGYRVGAYTSPHVVRFNERIAVDGEQADDEHIVQALQFVERFRGNTSLTYFEYTTLAAMRLFMQAQCELLVLEVGLGGRLDATNLWDADCAVVTSVALDHEAWLGNTRDAIGREKGAIGRTGRPLVIGDADPPDGLISLAREQGMLWQCVQPLSVAPTALPGEHQRRNAACAMAAVSALQARAPVDEAAAQAALLTARVSGRLERQVLDDIEVLLDVAHNPAAAQALAATLADHWPDRSVHVVFSVLADKDITGVVESLAPVVSAWYCGALTVPRAAPVNVLLDAVRHGAPDADVSGHESVPAAIDAALAACRAWLAAAPGESAPLLLVVGSFHTVEAWQHGRQDVPA